MIRLLAVLTLWSMLLGCVCTGTYHAREGYMRQDYWNKNRYNIYDEKGFRQGYIQRSYFDKNRFNIYK